MAAYIKEQIYASTYERNSTLMKEKVYSKPKKANGVKKTIKKVLFYISRGGSINIDNDEVWTTSIAKQMYNISSYKNLMPITVLPKQSFLSFSFERKAIYYI